MWLLLLGDELRAVPHPASSERELRIGVPEILAIESERVLLDGRLRILTRNGCHEWRYNTRDERHIDEFLFQLRVVTMREEINAMGIQAATWGDPLDLKFDGAEVRELDAGEEIVIRLFCTPKSVPRQKWLLKYESWTPGDYLGVTSRRLLWITDRTGGVGRKYGTISRYTPVRNVLHVASTASEEQHEVQFSVGGGLSWRVPFPVRLECAAKSFVKDMQDFQSWLASG